MPFPGLPLLLAGVLVSAAGGSSPGRTWVGTWTYDLCHEDRKANHDKDSFCREGRDRIRVERTGSGRHDITLCPADPWGERGVTVDRGGTRLRFRTRDGRDVRLTLAEDRDHFRGLFRTSDGHSGRVWGKRIAGCR